MNIDNTYQCEFDTCKKRCEYEFDKEDNKFKKETGWLINVIPNYIEVDRNSFTKTIWRGYDHEPTEDELKSDKIKMIAMMKELLECEYKDIQSEYENKLKSLDMFFIGI